MLLYHIRDYIAYPRHEIVSLIGTSLCNEYCCCLHTTPYITRLEAEFITSNNGFYSPLVSIAEEWLVRDHEVAPTYPSEMPGIVGGTIRQMPDIAKQTKALHNLRSPFLLAPNHVIRNQFVSGRVISGSHEHGENWDLLAETQPLSCITTGVTKQAPAWCHRMLGIGEHDGVKRIGDSRSLQRHIRKLWSYCEKAAPDKLYFGLAPTMLLRVANPNRFMHLAKSGKIALAKLGIVAKVFPPNTYPMKYWEAL